MFHLSLKHLLLQLHVGFLKDSVIDAKMGLMPCFVWLLLVSMIECRRLPDPEPQMYGVVQSPLYPQPYPPNLLEQWDLRVPEGYRISLTFTHLDIEASADCHYDALTVLEGGKVLGKFCSLENSTNGHHPGNHPILSTGNRLSLVFQSNDGNPERHQNVGFSAQYQATEVECPVPADVDKGRVTPVLPEYIYRDNISVHCDQGYKLMMDGFEIESFSTMCSNDGQWHLPLPQCHIIDCGEPEPLLNGGVTFVSGTQNQYLSLVEYHCNEPFYALLGGVTATFICEADRKWRSNDTITVKPTCIPVCGKPTELLPNFQRIFGGSDAPENTIPWQVLLNVEGGRGAGMVIADHWILTAANILQGLGHTAPTEALKIYMGSNDVKSIMISSVNSTSIHIHPDYKNPNFLDFNNDIALIKLQNPITFSSAVMPICLPPGNATYTSGTLGLVSGFGQEKTATMRRLTNKLKYVELPLVAQDTCHDSINRVKLSRRNVPELTSNMFCAGMPEGGKDSCQGDSGGPFALMDNGHFWAAGIVSWGVDCGRAQTYGVYTKVDNYVEWIKKTMTEN